MMKDFIKFFPLVVEWNLTGIIHKPNVHRIKIHNKQGIRLQRLTQKQIHCHPVLPAGESRATENTEATEKLTAENTENTEKT